MKYLIVFISLFTGNISFGQFGEEVGPLTGNPALQAKHKVLATAAKVNLGTFDSTFIYSPDTLSLPFFDEFSSNKFQQYVDDFSGPSVTFDKVYRLLDLTNNPVSVDSLYTEQPTYKKVIDLQALTSVEIPFTATQVKKGDLSSYPVVHITTDVYPPFYIYDTLLTTNGVDANPDTVWIPGPEVYQDSATQFFADLDDPEALWLDDEAYQNFSMAKDPWSLGVVTFDGLDGNGYPYAFGSSLTNFADHLTSKPIKLGFPTLLSDSVYFSFAYQSKGLCDQPESTDSLVLEFYANGLDQWNYIWSTQGTVLDKFKVVYIPVDDLDYFNDGFQFRFKNYGSLAGSLDHFHIDYVNLRKQPGGITDTALRDVAFSYPLHTLLNDYTSVPWDHYKNLVSPNSVMSTAVQVVMANSFPNTVNASDGTAEIYYSGGLEGAVTLISDVLCDDVSDNYQGYDIPYSYHNFQSTYTFDQSKLGISQEFLISSSATGGAANLSVNDSTGTIQHFKNYYSYDDGSAELAYGPTGTQSRLAIQYTTYEADTLLGAMIHFVPSVNDVSGNLFLLSVWADNNGQPGEVIYEDGLFFPRSPVYTYAQNIFGYYMFPVDSTVKVSGTYYIGWRQFEAERLNVGLDMNIVNNDHTFYSIDGGATWEQSEKEGSVMIRPIFSTAMNITLGIEPISSEPVVSIYPNPTKSNLTIKMDREFIGAELFNMQGQMILRSEFSTIDLSAFPNGMYLLKIDGVNKLHKIIKD